MDAHRIAGHEVDRLLEVNNVRLTMGGEPTFVSIDDMDGAEWNMAAHGAEQAAVGRAIVLPTGRSVSPRAR